MIVREAPKLWRTVVGGLVAAAALTVVLYGAAPLLIGAPLDVAAMLSGLAATTWESGLAALAVGTAVVAPAIYALLVYRGLAGPPWLRGVAWGVVLWLIAGVLIAPLADAGFFHAASGGWRAAAVSLGGHVLYGALLGGIGGPARRRRPSLEIRRIETGWTRRETP